MDMDKATPPSIRHDTDGVTTLHESAAAVQCAAEDLLDALQHELDMISADMDVRCVVLSGAGKAFCAGHDLREMRLQPRLSYYQALFTRCSRVMQSIQALPIPVIARVHGVATAAGCQLVASCDLAIAAETARFAVSGISVGLFCSTPAVASSRNVSPKRAFDMLVSARFIDAATACDWGLVNETVPEGGKAMFCRQRQMALSDAYAYTGHVMARNMMEEDASEGIETDPHTIAVRLNMAP